MSTLLTDGTQASNLATSPMVAPFLAPPKLSNATTAKVLDTFRPTALLCALAAMAPAGDVITVASLATLLYVSCRTQVVPV